ncbi:MAG TPA: hypothetical protein VEH55_01890 [Gaiellaceae bacterium]|nr:hypothetical protein [Gaiellaceae bacterium]
MRTRRKVLLALPAPLIVALALAAGGSSAAPPGATYGWNQPGCAPVVVPCAQPPASVPIAPAAVVVAPVPGSSYAWAQPGTAPVNTPSAQPPAWIPA